MRRTTGDSHIAGRDRERGAILPMAAAGIVVAVIAAALSIDLGAMAVKRKDLQKLADLAALDAAYVIDELAATPLSWPIKVGQLTGTASDPNERAAVLARESLERNGFDPAAANTLLVEVGEYTRDAAEEFQSCQSVLVVLGLGECEATAVRVTLADEMPKYFDMSAGSGSVTEVQAIAQMLTVPEDEVGEGTSYSVGSFLGRVEADTSTAPMPLVLGKITGLAPASLSTDLVSYKGIADTNVTLRDLAGELTAGDIDALFFGDITYRNFLSATIAVLERQSDETADLEYRARLLDAATGLRRIRDAIDLLEGSAPGTTIGSQTFSLSEIVAIEGVDADAGTGAESGADADLNTLDLVMGGAMVANGENAMTFDLGTDFSSSDLPEEVRPSVEQGVVDATIHVTVIEPPQLAPAAVEGTSISTAQLRIELDVTLLDELDVTQAVLGLPVVTPTGIVQGTIVDEATGGAVSGATVTLEGTQACAVTDGSGVYTIGGIVPDTYEVTVNATDRPPRQGTAVVPGAGSTTLNLGLGARGGSATGNVPDAGCLSLGGVQGTVRNALGLAVADAVVTIEQATGTACATTNVFGQYTISGLVPGSYPLKARATALQERTGTATVVAGAVSTADVTMNQVGSDVVAGCELAGSIVEDVVATSGVHVPVVLEGVKSTATVNDIDCASPSAEIAVVGEIVAAGIGEVSGLPEGADVLVPSEAGAPDLPSTVTGVVESLPRVEDTKVFAGPFAETQTYSLTDPTAVGNPLRDAIGVDLGPLSGVLGLLPTDITRVEDRLNTILDNRLEPIMILADWVGGGFGVDLLGTDVTVFNFDGCMDVTGLAGGRIPMLVE